MNSEYYFTQQVQTTGLYCSFQSQPQLLGKSDPHKLCLNPQKLSTIIISNVQPRHSHVWQSLNCCNEVNKASLSHDHPPSDHNACFGRVTRISACWVAQIAYLVISKLPLFLDFSLCRHEFHHPFSERDQPFTRQHLPD